MAIQAFLSHYVVKNKSATTGFVKKSRAIVKRNNVTPNARTKVKVKLSRHQVIDYRPTRPCTQPMRPMQYLMGQEFPWQIQRQYEKERPKTAQGFPAHPLRVC